MRNFEVEVNQRHFKVVVSELVPEGGLVQLVAAKAATNVSPIPARAERKQTGEVAMLGAAKCVEGEVRSSMPGLIKQLLVKEGDTITQGQKLMILEAMKMESEVFSDRPGRIESLKIKLGETVEDDQLLMVLK